MHICSVYYLRHGLRSRRYGRNVEEGYSFPRIGRDLRIEFKHILLYLSPLVLVSRHWMSRSVLPRKLPFFHGQKIHPHAIILH